MQCWNTTNQYSLYASSWTICWKFEICLVYSYCFDSSSSVSGLQNENLTVTEKSILMVFDITCQLGITRWLDRFLSPLHKDYQIYMLEDMTIPGMIHDISSKHSAGGNNWKSISLSQKYYIIYLSPLKLSAFLFRCYVLTKVKL